MQQKIFFVLGEKPPHRTQSPSSIGIFKQCPRKYYYAYIQNLPTKPSTATTRGTITHSVLEKFYDIPIENITWNNCEQHLTQHIQHLILQEWQAHKKEFDTFNLNQNERIQLFEETLHMLFNWLHNHLTKLRTTQLDFATAFKQHIPEREQNYHSSTWHTRGIIDAIETTNGNTHVMDYKTSNHTNIDEYKLQLAIYALLYKEKHGRLPDKAGIYFLKANQTKYLQVNQELLEHAQQEILNIHQHTTQLQKEHYPKHITHLCKWTTGQCDFYDTCRADD